MQRRKLLYRRSAAHYKEAMMCTEGERIRESILSVHRGAEYKT